MRILGVTASSYELYPAFESIATATGTGSSGTITFSSIPSTYQHLQLRIIARSTRTTSSDLITLNFNNDSAGNYAYHRLSGTGAAVAAAGSATQTFLQAGNVATNGSGSNVMGVVIIDIHDYASTSKNKTIRVFDGYDDNGTGNIALRSGLWMSTTAVNRIDLGSANGENWTTSSTFALYGIKGS